MRFSVIVASGLLFGCLALGCSRGGSPSPSAGAPRAPAAPAAATTPEGDAGPFAAGRTVFEENRCGRCHTTTGEGGEQRGGRQRGPDLAKVGSKRDRDWILAHVRNAKTHNPRSRMPPFEGHINDVDLAALADYLASLK